MKDRNGKYLQSPLRTKVFFPKKARVISPRNKAPEINRIIVQSSPSGRYMPQRRSISPSVVVYPSPHRAIHGRNVHSGIGRSQVSRELPAMYEYAGPAMA